MRWDTKIGSRRGSLADGICIGAIDEDCVLFFTLSCERKAVLSCDVEFLSRRRVRAGVALIAERRGRGWLWVGMEVRRLGLWLVVVVSGAGLLSGAVVVGGVSADWCAKTGGCCGLWWWFWFRLYPLWDV